jgi:tetratricopeptide (TPR) repeat protein
VRALTALSINESQRDDIDGAAKLIEQASELADEMGDRFSVAVTMVQRGRLDEDLGDREGAIGRFDEAIEIFKELGARWEMADALAERGICYRDLGRLDEGEVDLRAAIRISTELGEQQIRPAGLQQRGLPAAGPSTARTRPARYDLRRMLHERDDALRHEAGRPDGLASPGHLDDLDDAPTRGNLDAPARAGRHDLVCLHAVADVHHDLDAVAPHADHDRHRRRRGPRDTFRRLGFRLRSARTRARRPNGRRVGAWMWSTSGRAAGSTTTGAAPSIRRGSRSDGGSSTSRPSSRRSR